MWFFNKPKKVKPILDYSRLKKKAPRVPDITCPAIDSILESLEKIASKERKYTMRNFNSVKKRLEKLRVANELLRESGIYWNQVCKDLLKNIRKS